MFSSISRRADRDFAKSIIKNFPQVDRVLKDSFLIEVNLSVEVS